MLSLEEQNAARLLLNAVNDLFGTSAANLPAAQRTREKEKEFYAAVFDTEPRVRREIFSRSIAATETDLSRPSSRSGLVQLDSSQESWPEIRRGAPCRSRPKRR